MPLPGFADLVVIVFVVLVIFGASKLQQIATSLGKFLVNLKSRQTEPDEKSDPH